MFRAFRRSDAMANLLLVDPNDVAQRALRGFLGRGAHRCAVAPDAAEAWRLLREFVGFDLIVLELQLQGENGARFLQRLRADPLLKSIPVVIYTAVADPKVVKAVMPLKIQNYLIKPYREDHLFREIDKAVAAPWRAAHFEEERSFCAQLELAPEGLRRRRVELQNALEAAGAYVAAHLQADIPARGEILRRLGALQEQAEAAGIWAVSEYITSVRPRLEAADLSVLKTLGPDFAWLGQLIFDHLHPGMLKASGFGEDDKAALEEAQKRALWLETDVDTRGPILEASTVQAEVDQLTTCPAIDTSLAAFQMSAERSGSLLQQVSDLVVQDPGLACAVLAAANQLHHAEMTDIEDIPGAVSLLGSERLVVLAKTIPPAPEASMNVPPVTWPQFWRFQIGVGRVAKAVCDYLQFRNAASVAYQAGLLHDIGKILLLHLHPHGFEALVRYSQARKVPLHVAERRYFGCDTRDLGDRFARRLGLPERLCAVIRWVERPGEVEPGETAELVGAVALARELCLNNHVGYCGDTPGDPSHPIQETAAWAALQPRVYPGFRMEEFEAQIRRVCFDLKETLHAR